MTIGTSSRNREGKAALRGGTEAERLDRLPLTALHVAILALCTLGLAADIGEVGLSNTFSALFLAPPYSASRVAVGWLLASVFAGGAIGAPIFGWLADRVGRRAALQGALVIFVVGSLAAAASPDITWLTTFRFVTGLALGGYPPLTAAYLADVMPPRRRGALMMLCAALAFLGAPGMIFLVRWLTPLAPFAIEGWRWGLIAGAAVSATTALLFFLIPESPRWLATVGRAEEAERAYRRFEGSAAAGNLFPVDPPPKPALAATADFGRPDERGRNIGRLFLLAILFGLAPWAAIGFPLLSAAVVIQKGFRLGDSLLFAGLSTFGPTLGIAFVAPFLDAMQRRFALVLCAIVMALTGLVFAVSTDLVSLTVLGLGFNLMSAVYSAVISIYAAELFPTALRASATSLAWAFGRAVSAFVPLALLPLLHDQGPLAMFGVIAAALLSSALLIIVAGPPGRARSAVE